MITLSTATILRVATRRWQVIALTVAYLSTIVAANLLTATVGQVHIGAVAVTAGTFAVGLSFVARDALHDAVGRRELVFAAIAGGAVISGLLTAALAGPKVDPTRLAVASGVTFLAAEAADMRIFTWLRKRSRLLAWVVSNLIAAPIDSILFLWLADFPLAGFRGQSLVKIAVGVITPLLLAPLLRKETSNAVLRHRLNRTGA